MRFALRERDVGHYLVLKILEITPHTQVLQAGRILTEFCSLHNIDLRREGIVVERNMIENPVHWVREEEELLPWQRHPGHPYYSAAARRLSNI